MNTAEKIASLYLRLNGFMQLPLFTVFDGKDHNHMDLLAVRMANSEERCGEFVLPLDEKLFAAIGGQVENPKTVLLKIICEVRSNKQKDTITESHYAYAQRFLGGGQVLRMIVYDESDLEPVFKEGYLHVGIRHALKTTLHRFKQMQDKKLHLTKTGSWYMSDEWLADMLILYRLGAFK